MDQTKNINKAGAAVNGSATMRSLVNDGVPDMVNRLKDRPDTFTGSRTNITFEAFPDVMRAYRAYAGHCKARQVDPRDAYNYLRKPWCKLGVWARQGLTYEYFKECFWDAANVSFVRSWAEIRADVCRVFGEAAEHSPRRHRGIDLEPGQLTYRELLKALERPGYRQVNSGDLRRYVLDVLERDGFLVHERPERRGQSSRLYLTVAPETALEHLERLATAIGAAHEVQRARNVLDGQVRAKRRAENIARASAAHEAQKAKWRQAQIEAAAYAREHPQPVSQMFLDLLNDSDSERNRPATIDELRTLAARRRTYSVE